MGVSIWEGSKAQALIDAISTQKIDKQQGSANAGKALVVGSDGIVIPASVGIDDAVKNALLACFRNVAWINESGSNYYNTLEAVLNGRSPIPVDDYTWKYDPKLNVLLSQYEYITPDLTGVTENISNGVLNIHIPSGGSYMARYEFKTQTNHHAKMNARLKVNAINDVGVADPAGIRMQLSNGNSGTAMYICRRNGSNSIFVREGTSPIKASTINIGEWVDITVELKDNAQAIWVNGEKTFESSILNTYYCSSNVFLVRRADDQTTDLDIAYLSYKNDD